MLQTLFKSILLAKLVIFYVDKKVGDMMLTKNVKLYIEKFKDLSSDSFERIKNFIEGRKFNKNDVSKFENGLNNFINRSTTTIKIILYIIPEPTPRPRLAFNHFYVKNSSSNNKFAEVLVKENKDIFQLVKTECKFKVKCFLPTPKYFKKVRTLLAELGIIRPTRRPDWDNLGKTYSDMVQKWIIEDDSLIVDGETHKYYSLKPRVEIIIEYFDDNNQ